MESNPIVGAVIDCIKKNMHDERFGVAKLCEIVGQSERKLQRNTRKCLNKSPSQLISSLRLQRARELIVGGFPIAQAGYEVGFGSHQYFTRKFKMEFGKPPSEWRKNPGCGQIIYKPLLSNKNPPFNNTIMVELKIYDNKSELTGGEEKGQIILTVTDKSNGKGNSQKLTIYEATLLCDELRRLQEYIDPEFD